MALTCIYCGEPSGEYDEHEECVAAALDELSRAMDASQTRTRSRPVPATGPNPA